MNHIEKGAGGLNFLFYRFLTSKALTTISLNAFIIYYMWDIVSQYRSVFLAGLLITIYLAVDLILSFPVGHLIDRINNTLLNMISSMIMLSGFGLLLLGSSLSAIYAATGIAVLGQTMKIDSFSAIMKKHLSESSFRKAVSANYVLNSVSSLAGTLAGGLSIVYLPKLFDYLILLAVFISLVISWPAPEASYRLESAVKGASAEIKIVLSFLRKIAGFMLLAFFLNGLLISLDTYASGLFYLILRSSPVYYTAFSMSVPLGSIAGSPIANTKYFKKDRPLTFALLIFLFSPSIMILSFSRSPILDVADAFFMGFILPLINIPLQAKLMEVVPYSIYGRVSAFLKIFTSSSSPVMGSIFSTLTLFLSIPTVLFWVSIFVVPLALYTIKVITSFYRLNATQK